MTERPANRGVDALASEVADVLRQLADPVRAESMASYMKHVAPFYGIPAPLRRSATKELRREVLLCDADEILAFARLCFDASERECHYVALDVLQKAGRGLSEQALPLLRELAVTRSWWDTIDGLSPIVGAGAARFASWRVSIDDWATDQDIWIRRIAILHQNHYGDATDADRLFRIILQNASDREFFIRKAIGWALRTLAWKQPELVIAFVDEHQDVLSPLSIREAVKNIERKR